MRRSDFPYVVEVAAHVRGQQAMYDFHARQGIRAWPVSTLLRSSIASVRY
jgi:hypothetical protein